ncbi:MAG: iron-sulfur cluster assembly scaffold protein [Desulfobacteraceae bacterium]|nr:iron-sulfur cluster assembly scaffold protein [Desulfobacteraceae bacterium]
MNDSLDDFVNQLQNKINDEAKGVLGKQGFERWQNPQYRGKLDNFHAHGRITGTCGDTMEIFLKIENDSIKEASYLTDGCGTSNVCGSFAAEMTIGKSFEQLPEITGESILNRLGEVPKDEQHCAFLAASTIQEAIDDYMIKKNNIK